MKKTILLLSIIALIYSCEKQESLAPNAYEITVNAKGIHNGMRAYIQLINYVKKEITLDTALVMNEVFSFKGKVSNASMSEITINGITGRVQFILEPGKINIEIYKDSIYFSKVSGSKNNEVYNLYKAEQRKITKILREIRQQINVARNSGNSALASELNEKYLKKNKGLVGFVHEFIEEHPDSDFSLMLLEKMIVGKNPDIEKFNTNLATLKSVIDKNLTNKLIGESIETFIKEKESQANLEIGKVAPNFTSTTPTGEALSLNDIKGKVTIIEFWAAWCAPCRRENPNIVKVYNKYHEKGLEIIGVSLDGTGRQKDPKAVWLKAIEDDKLTWHHVSSLKYFNDPVARLYNINSIPAAFILDKDGIIVAKNLRGQALEDQIASMLD